MKDTSNILKWRFDISTFRLIGRDLITDRVTALFELVKNSYDANAQLVNITFENIGVGKDNSRICIIDDGYGMSFEDIRDKWMVIGTSSKRKSPYSPMPFNRKCVGEKGVGRFAVDKLGDKVSIVTKKKGTDKWLKVDIDWSEYYKDVDDSSSLHLFTDVENYYSFIEAEDSEVSGTKLIISSIRESWTQTEINHLIKEISRLVSPFSNPTYPCRIVVNAPEFGINKNAVSTINELKLATQSFSISYNNDKHTQESIYFDKEDFKFKKKDVEIKSFGGIKMRIYFFDDKARRTYRSSFPNDPISGFKVYRDGIIATPFAESNEDPDKKRDVLGIDKRLWRDIFSRVSSREFIGSIDITQKDNPNIKDATNRQDFVDNKEFRDFKEFVITQLNALQSYKIALKEKEKANVQKGLENASNDIKQLINTASTILTNNPSLKNKIDPLISQAKKTGNSVDIALREHKKEKEDFIRKENVYLSIMSLQEYAIQMTHAVRTTLNQIRDRIEFFYRFYPNPDEDLLFQMYAKQMYIKFKVLNKVINFMLSYSHSNLKPEEINVKSTFEEVLSEYRNIFLREGIILKTIFPKEELLLLTNRQFIRDILQNIIDNSIKAISLTTDKIIQCSYEIKDDHLIILISDTGVGIPKERREQVFALYYTTTEGQGGAGVGLYIVKTRVESLKGTVSVIDSEFGDIGTTIRISIPFNIK